MSLFSTRAIQSVFVSLLLLASAGAWAGKRIETNEVFMPDAPAWVTSSRVNRVVEHIQDNLEWDIRKITVRWYTDQAQFRRAHGFDDTVVAFSQKADNTVHLGPRVTASNFDDIFGHELVHVILYQKYKDAVPRWLEEGMANFFSKHGHVDYRWLASQPVPEVTQLVHPFGASATVSPQYHYMASTAVMEMIASKCQVSDLLQLSVGKKLETYLSTYCGIPDVTASFREWLKKKSR